MDVRIGLVDSPRDLELELPDDTDVEALRTQFDGLLAGGTGVLWVTDRKGNQVAVSGARVTYVALGTGSAKGRVGFG